MGSEMCIRDRWSWPGDEAARRARGAAASAIGPALPGAAELQQREAHEHRFAELVLAIGLSLIHI